MKIYIGTSLSNHAAASDLAAALVRDLGVAITHNWMQGFMRAVQSGDVESMPRIAKAEVLGVKEADVVIILLPGGRGTHVEMGIAIGARKPVILVRGGDIDMVPFYYAPNVRCVQTASDGFSLVRELMARDEAAEQLLPEDER